jgi:hypothetical protein
MRSDHVIDFNEDGTVASLHNDKFNLGFLGKQNITRVSDIRFDCETQTWAVWIELATPDVFDTTYPELGGFSSYEEARCFEIAALNLCREAQIHPSSPMGRWAMVAHRATFDK